MGKILDPSHDAKDDSNFQRRIFISGDCNEQEK